MFWIAVVLTAMTVAVIIASFVFNRKMLSTKNPSFSTKIWWGILKPIGVFLFILAIIAMNVLDTSIGLIGTFVTYTIWSLLEVVFIFKIMNHQSTLAIENSH